MRKANPKAPRASMAPGPSISTGPLPPVPVSKKKHTSTPKKDADDTVCSIDLSSISQIGGFISQQPDHSKITTRKLNESVPLNMAETRKAAKAPPKKKDLSKEKKEYDSEHIMDAVNNFYLQTLFLDKVLSETNQMARDKIDRRLLKLQNEIAKKRGLLQKITNETSRIAANMEVEKVLARTCPDLNLDCAVTEAAGQVASTRHGTDEGVSENISPTKRNCDKLSKELERMRNTIACENVVIPESSATLGRLHSVLKQSREASENLADELCSQSGDKEKLGEILSGTLAMNDQLNEEQARCGERLSVMEELAMQDLSQKIIESQLAKK